MFSVVQKLKNVKKKKKKALSSWHCSKLRISAGILVSREELDRIQTLISIGSEDRSIRLAEKDAKEILTDRILVEESMLKQKIFLLYDQCSQEKIRGSFNGGC